MSNTTHQLDQPAFPEPQYFTVDQDGRLKPMGEDYGYFHRAGFTQRQYMAIQLKVPMSGDPNIDAMIRQSRRMDLAGQAMQGLSAGLDHDTFRLLHDGVRGGMRQARVATVLADALLIASESTPAQQDDGKAELIEACKAAKAHIEELREAWMTGAIHESDNLGGTRSNRNVDVDCLLRDVLTSAKASVKP